MAGLSSSFPPGLPCRDSSCTQGCAVQKQDHSGPGKHSFEKLQESGSGSLKWLPFVWRATCFQCQSDLLLCGVSLLHFVHVLSRTDLTVECCCYFLLILFREHKWWIMTKLFPISFLCTLWKPSNILVLAFLRWADQVWSGHSECIEKQTTDGCNIMASTLFAYLHWHKLKLPGLWKWFVVDGIHGLDAGVKLLCKWSRGTGCWQLGYNTD